MRVLTIMLIFFSLCIYAQPNTVVSLDSSNVWIYQIDFEKYDGSLVEYDTYSAVYKIIGDIIISGKESKIMEITEYDSVKLNTGLDYWFSDSTLFQKDFGYSSIVLYTFFDKNRKSDTSWSDIRPGGGYVNGSITVGNIDIFDSSYHSNRYYVQSGDGINQSTIEIIASEKFGIVYMLYDGWTGLFHGEQIKTKLVGAEIKSQIYGKIKPPEIISWYTNEDTLNINLSIDGDSLVDVLYYHKFDSTSQKYPVIDSIQTSSTSISKSLEPGNYRMRFSYKSTTGYLSSLSNRISFEIDTSSDINHGELPSQFFVYQNYPNPINGTTRIGYEIKNPAPVYLEIFNLLGEKIEKQEQTNNEGGYYEFLVNVDELSSGVYFYIVKTASQKNFTYKMIVLK